MRYYLLLPFALFCINLSSIQAQSIDKLWESNKGLPTPESVLFNEANNILYVSLIDGGATDKDGKGGVAQLNLDGTMKNGTWLTGLNAPKGMAIYKDLIYIADITSVVIADIVSGNIVDEIVIPESKFLNDVTVDDRGTVYVSDSQIGKIYQVKNGGYTLFLDNAPSVNGLKYDKGKLLALVGKEMWSIDSNKQVNVLTKGLEQNGDGIEPIGNGDYLATSWAGIVYYIKSDGTISKLQDVQGKMNTADLGYNPKTKILYIPTFNNNSVIAYQLK